MERKFFHERRQAQQRRPQAQIKINSNAPGNIPETERKKADFTLDCVMPTRMPFSFAHPP